MNSSRVSLWLAAGIDAWTSVKVPPYLVHRIGIANVQRLEECTIGRTDPIN